VGVRSLSTTLEDHPNEFVRVSVTVMGEPNGTAKLAGNLILDPRFSEVGALIDNEGGFPLPP